MPAPVDVAARPSAFRARRLDAPPLTAWIARWAGAPEDRRWTDRQLAVAALALRADVARARADWRAAVAAEPAAQARPSPGAQASVERAVSGSGEASPWVVSLAGLLSVELGGKRGARLQRARAHSATAEGALRLAAWRVVHDSRMRAADLLAAETESAALRRQVDALVSVEALERARFEEGSVASTELARTASEVQAARVEAAAAEAAALDARAALAAAIAMPARALDSLEVAPDSTVGCRAAERLPTDTLAARALTRRPELGLALAQYAVSEADLRTEVARQYPDLELGPGFIWDQGVNRWTLALALPKLLGFLNQAPLRAAEANRHAAAGGVAEAQEAVLVDVETAIAACRAARLLRDAADAQVEVAAEAARLADAAYARGETSRLDPALAVLARLRAERARAAAERHLTLAGLSLEAATGDWTGDGTRWPDPREDGPMEGATP